MEALSIRWLSGTLLMILDWKNNGALRLAKDTGTIAVAAARN